MAERYLIVCGQYWWRQKGYGYTMEVAEAGLFDKEYAEKIHGSTSGSGEHLMEPAEPHILNEIEKTKRKLVRLMAMAAEADPEAP